MARPLRMVCAAIAVPGLLWRQAFAESPPPRVLIKDSNMGYRWRVLCIALLALASGWQPVDAQTASERPLATDSKGCNFVDPTVNSPVTIKDFVWSGACKDGYLSGPGTLSSESHQASLTGDFVAGEVLSGTLRDVRTTYEGAFKNNKPHGLGTLRFQNGFTISSSFNNGSSEGLVKISWSDGTRYEGEFNHQTGKTEGRGKVVYLNGDVYEGQFRDDEFEGEGVYTLIAGEVRTGTFVKGALTGEGSILYANGAKYRGQVQHDDPNGKGRMEYADGTAYEGEFVAGLYQGSGVLRQPDGTIYEGQFRAHAAEGLGKQVFSNGDVYEGEMLAGHFHGTGKLVKWDGGVEEGQWQSGKLNGQCTIKTKYTLKRGQCRGGDLWGLGHGEDSRINLGYDGEFRDGLFHGKGVLVEGKGYRYEGDFEAGLRTGRGKEVSGLEEYEGEFAGGLRAGQGRLKATSAAGVTVIYEGRFSGGKLDGPGVLTIGPVRLDGEFESGEFARGRIEGGGKKFEIDVAKQTFLEILPDGSKRPVGAEDLSSYGIRS